MPLSVTTPSSTNPDSADAQVLRKQLAPWNTNVEVLFETEHDVQKVNRFRSQVADQSRLTGHFVVIDPQRVDEGFSDLLKDLF